MAGAFFITITSEHFKFRRTVFCSTEAFRCRKAGKNADMRLQLSAQNMNKITNVAPVTDGESRIMVELLMMLAPVGIVVSFAGKLYTAINPFSLSWWKWSVLALLHCFYCCCAFIFFPCLLLFLLSSLPWSMKRQIS